MNGENSENAEQIVPHHVATIWQVIWICSFFPLVWLSLLMFPVYPVAPELDLSWAGALPYFAHRGLHFGTDIIFTFGPLGHFIGYAYSGYLTTERTIWELAIKGFIAGLICWSMSELRLAIRIILAACILLFLGNFEEVYSFAIVLSGLMLLRLHERRIWVAVILGVFLALLALVKFTYFIQAMGAVAFASGFYLFRGRWNALASLVVGFTGGIIVIWILADQRIGDIPFYISNSLAITSGYNAAMFMPTPEVVVVWVALVGVSILAVQLTLFCLHAEDKVRARFGSLLLMLMLFFLWKHSFTRWLNHAPRFFCFLAVLAPASWLVTGRTTLSYRKATSITCVVILFALAGLEAAQRGRVSRVFLDCSNQMRAAYSRLMTYRAFDNLRRTMLLEKEGACSLPRIKAAVNDKPVDVLGYRQGIALLNKLNYSPRPIFQGYSAYTNSLIEINTRHYQSVHRPEFVISKLETIDDRFMTLDDAGAVLELLYHYRPMMRENGWQLWEVVSPVRPVDRQSISEFNAKIGEEVALPDVPFIWAQLKIEHTSLGKIAETFYKSGPVFLELVNDSGWVVRYRIVPSMADYGFLLNPEIKSDDDLAAVATGGALHKYRSMRVDIDSAYQRLFRPKVRIKLSALPNPERVLSNPVAPQIGAGVTPDIRNEDTNPSTE